jgi:hypothetical protein
MMAANSAVERVPNLLARVDEAEFLLALIVGARTAPISPAGRAEIVEWVAMELGRAAQALERGEYRASGRRRAGGLVAVKGE